MTLVPVGCINTISLQIGWIQSTTEFVHPTSHRAGDVNADVDPDVIERFLDRSHDRRLPRPRRAVQDHDLPSRVCAAHLHELM
jgi:hypothetical protein